MNPGGEPERDDTGLPPVDIEIPDDARELDRDVQAYYREQRARRRRERRQRLHGSLARDGIVLPLLACCLILALITGTLLTVFTATSDQILPSVGGKAKPTAGPHSAGGSQSPGSSAATPTGAPSHSTSASPRSSASSASVASSASAAGAAGAAASQGIVPVPGLLPDVSLTIGGHMVRARALSGTLLVLIPPACQCAAMLKWLTGISAQAGAPTYLVGTPKTIREVRHLYNRLPATLAARAEVAYDANSVLQDRYGAAAHGLTAILVRPNQHVDTDHLTVSGGGASLIQALTD